MNMDEQLRRREQVSALADGQLHGTAFSAAVEHLRVDEDGRASWHLYHLIGDVMRSGELGACGHDQAFVARLSARLQAEPAVGRPSEVLSTSPEIVAVNDDLTKEIGQNGLKNRPSANDGVYRWKMVAGLALAVAAGAIGWTGLSGRSADAPLARQAAPDAVTLARIDAPGGSADAGRVGTSGGPVMIRDAQLDALVAAHRQFGGSPAFQNTAGFLRNATFDATAPRAQPAPGP